jgi:hypothetical protein
MALTAAAIKNAKGKAKPYKLTDSDGLFLYVTPISGRYWRMNYRHFGKQKTLAFGIYPDTGLADAREQRDAARKVLAKGNDPAEKIRLGRIAATVAASSSFKAVADEWLVKVEREGRCAVTMKKLRWLLAFINASLGKRPVTAITAQEVLTMLRKMEAKGRYETAKRLRSTCSQILRYAIATARAERDVAMDLRGVLIAPKPVHCAAITSAENAGGLLRAIEAFEGFANTKLLPHAFVRPGVTPCRMGRLRFRQVAVDHPDAIERQLAHCANNAVRRAYTRGEYWDKRVRMMQHWSDHLDFLRDGQTVVTGKFGKAKSQAA